MTQRQGQELFSLFFILISRPLLAWLLLRCVTLPNESQHKGSPQTTMPIGMPLRCLDLKSLFVGIPRGEGGHHPQRDYCLGITGNTGKVGIAPWGWAVPTLTA